MLSDAQWSRIKDLLPGGPTARGGRAADNRLFVEAVLYAAWVGCPWRDLPESFGNWHSIYVRFSCWEKGDVWERVAQALGQDADMEALFIDSTVVRVHQHAAGALKKRWRSGDRPLAGRIEHQDQCLPTLGLFLCLDTVNTAWRVSCAGYATPEAGLKIVGIENGDIVRRTVTGEVPRVRLEIRGKREGEVFWLVNGRTLARQPASRAFMLVPETPGRYDVTVTDAVGHFDRVGVLVQ